MNTKIVAINNENDDMSSFISHRSIQKLKIKNQEFQMQKKSSLPCSEITETIIRCYYKTIDSLGTVRGTPVPTFRSQLAFAIHKQGLRVQINKTVEVRDNNGRLIDTVKVEMVVDGLVIVNIKNVLELTTKHFASGTYQMEVGGYPVGLLLNYGEKDRKIRRFTAPRHYRKGPWKCPGL